MRSAHFLPVVIALSALLGAQSAGNVLQHFDDTPEATSRGDGAPSDTISIMQRYPWNQCCGRTQLCCVRAILQDNNPASPEWFYLEVRGSDVSDPNYPLGKPDMTSGGLLATMPLPGIFLGAGPQLITFNLPTCVPLPTGTGAAADFYVGFRFNPSPAWPADGVSCNFSGTVGAFPGEQYVANPKPMYAAAPRPGLGWSYNWNTAVLTLNTGELAWAIGAGLQEDVCQPFAANAGRFTGTYGVAGAGVNPNFGYAGIWPDLTASTPDQIGWRVRTVAPPSSPCWLFVGLNLQNPIALDPLGVHGLLCIDPHLVVAQLTTSEQLCATDSNAVFGPYSVPSYGVCLGAQAVTLDANGWHLSTACTTAL